MAMPIFLMLSVGLNIHQFYNEMYHHIYEIKGYDNRNTMVKKKKKKKKKKNRKIGLLLKIRLKLNK